MWATSFVQLFLSHFQPIIAISRHLQTRQREWRLWNREKAPREILAGACEANTKGVGKRSGFAFTLGHFICLPLELTPPNLRMASVWGVISPWNTFMQSVKVAPHLFGIHCIFLLWKIGRILTGRQISMHLFRCKLFQGRGWVWERCNVCWLCGITSE